MGTYVIPRARAQAKWRLEMRIRFRRERKEFRQPHRVESLAHLYDDEGAIGWDAACKGRWDCIRIHLLRVCLPTLGKVYMLASGRRLLEMEREDVSSSPLETTRFPDLIP